MNCTFEDLKLQLAINYTGDGKRSEEIFIFQCLSDRNDMIGFLVIFRSTHLWLQQLVLQV